MTSEDGSIAVVVNGEIYNFQALRREPRGQGAHLQVTLGLRGARPPLRGRGRRLPRPPARHVRPCALGSPAPAAGARARPIRQEAALLPRRTPRASSSPPSSARLAESGRFERRPHIEAIDAFLVTAVRARPRRTAFEGVKKLPAGCRLISEARNISVSRSAIFSFASTSPPTGSLPELTERLHAHVHDAVRVTHGVGRAARGVPLRRTRLVARRRDDGHAVVASRSRRSPSASRAKTSASFPYAKMVSERYGTDHHEIVVEPDMASVIPEFVRHYGEPFADSSALPTWYLCRVHPHRRHRRAERRRRRRGVRGLPAPLALADSARMLRRTPRVRCPPCSQRRSRSDPACPRHSRSEATDGG